MDYSGISNNPNDNAPRHGQAPPAAPTSPLAQEYANAIHGNPDLFSARTGHTPFFSPVSGSAWQNDGSGVSAYNASFGGKDYLFMPSSGRENSGGSFQTKFTPQQLAQLGGTEVSGPSVQDGTYNAGGYLFGRDPSGGFKTPGGQVVGPSQLRGLSGYAPGTANGKDTFNALAQVLSPALIPLGGAGVLGGAVGGGAAGAAANAAGIGAGIGSMGEDPAKGAILGGIGGAIKGGFGLGGTGSPSVTGEVDGVGYGGIGAVPGGMDIPAGTTAGGLSATGADLSVGGAFPAESGANPIPIGSADYADAAATPGGAQNVANFLGGSSVGTQTGFGDIAMNAEQSANVSGIAGGGSADSPFSGTFENLPEAIKQFAQSKFALPAAGLAANLLLGNRGIPESGALAGSQNLQGNALAQLKNAQAGNISPAQQTMVAKFRTDSISQASQYLVNAGMGGIHKDPKTGQMTADSSAGLDMLQKIEANAQALQQGFADQLFSQSLQQLGISDAATSTLINLRLRQQQQTGQALSNFMLAYAYLEGRGGSGGGHG